MLLSRFITFCFPLHVTAWFWGFVSISEDVEDAPVPDHPNGVRWHWGPVVVHRTLTFSKLNTPKFQRRENVLLQHSKPFCTIACVHICDISLGKNHMRVHILLATDMLGAVHTDSTQRRNTCYRAITLFCPDYSWCYTWHLVFCCVYLKSFHLNTSQVF